MFTTLSTLILLAASFVNALPTPSPVPTGAYIQDADLLEPYATFHTRYVAWNCKNLHSTAFYDSCCHPLLKDEPVSALPALCSNPPSVKSTITVTSTVTVTDDALPTASVAAVANAATDNNNAAADNNNADDGECNDDGGDGSVEVDAGEDCPDGTEEVTDNNSSVNNAVDNNAVNSPSPSTTTKPALSTTTHKPTSTKAAAAIPAPASVSGSGKSYKGTATYFMQNGGYGACGDKHKDSELGGAINFHLYGDSSKKSSWCGKDLVVTNTKNNKSTTIKIWDDCPSCNGGGDIDLSQGAFKALMDDGLGEGVFPISWQLAE